VTCIDSHVPELRRLARTLTTWREEFLAYFRTGRISNGPTEAANLLIKQILRVGHGFRNYDNYRLRLLLHCGITWQHHTPTPLRGRLPRLAAPLNRLKAPADGICVSWCYICGNHDGLPAGLRIEPSSIVPVDRRRGHQ
jgi:hypothetical protein